ncbi:MAG: hypothetical protein AB7G28_02895 [Pirellulales bacterium]
MTIQQLEQRLIDLEQEVAELRREVRPLRPFSDVAETFGLFANDLGFDEVVRLGREYREQVNSESDEC